MNYLYLIHSITSSKDQFDPSKGEVRFTVEETEGQDTPPEKTGRTVIQNADKIYNIDKIDHAEFN
jgi:hypothetical protein